MVPVDCMIYIGRWGWYKILECWAESLRLKTPRAE